MEQHYRPFRVSKTERKHLGYEVPDLASSFDTLTPWAPAPEEMGDGERPDFAIGEISLRVADCGAALRICFPSSTQVDVMGPEMGLMSSTHVL